MEPLLTGHLGRCVNICTLFVFVLALKLHILMLVSFPVSFLFSDVLILFCVVFFVQATSFNERNASLVALQVL